MNYILFFPVIAETVDELGQATQTVIDYSRQVFCDKKAIPQSEFFAGGQQGIKPAICLIVGKFDYQNETTVKFEGIVYSIYRKYETHDETIELYGEVRSGAH
ncbi:phage head-tail adapter protein [Sporolactobacillus sp. CQH2019]|uniref:phage head-tail adapter protein n=1 Tax=Sporolactobacillus sp. CQH2019 TaxID=3023512 RepID=UPI002368F135|nr:phage head-tail adapter protein [Sporolactobacillus sp. CQH2019]MDD9149256.1 phage head-tail adapter protein [Sporolactobacillus sp. CQH2019]